MSWLWGPRRKTKKQRLKEKGRRSYRTGKQFEKKVDPFLRKEGYSVLRSRVHSRGLREEFDRIVADKKGRLYGVEIKGTKQKVGTPVVRKLKKKVHKHKNLLHGGILVSKSGFSKPTQEYKDIKQLRYKQKRKRASDEWSW